MVCLTIDEIVLLADQAEYQGSEGVLYLTNRKIAFDHEQRGTYFIGLHSALSISIENISSVSVVAFGQFKKLIIQVVVDFNTFGNSRHEFKLNNPEKWKERIELIN